MQNFDEILKNQRKKKEESSSDRSAEEGFRILLPSHDRGAADGGFMQMWSIGKVGHVHLSHAGPTGEIIVMDGWMHKTRPWMMEHEVHPTTQFAATAARS